MMEVSRRGFIGGSAALVGAAAVAGRPPYREGRAPARPGVPRAEDYAALLVPTVIHGLYDYIAVNETESFSTTFVVFVLVVFVLAFVLVKQLSKRDEYIG